MKTIQTVSPKAKILSLKPELHENIIREGRRISHAKLPLEFKYHFILNGITQISKLTLLDLCLNNLHSGRENIIK